VKNVQYQHADFSPGVGDDAAEQVPERRAVASAPAAAADVEPFVRSTQKVGRNDPVPVRLGQEVQAVPRKLPEP
jgi:hypothetical protein